MHVAGTAFQNKTYWARTARALVLAKLYASRIAARGTNKTYVVTSHGFPMLWRSAAVNDEKNMPILAAGINQSNTEQLRAEDHTQSTPVSHGRDTSAAAALPVGGDETSAHRYVDYQAN